MKPTKVVHMTSVHPVNDVRILQKMCKSLSTKYDFTLLLPNFEDEAYEGVKISSFKLPIKNRFHRMTKVVNQMYKEALKLDADIYHFHDPELTRIGKKLARKGKKVIYDVHEDVPRQILGKTYIPSFLKKPISWFVEKFEMNSAKKFAAIVTATPFIADRFLKANKNTVNINNYPVLDEMLSDFNYDDKTGNKVSYVGVISENRGIKEIVSALEFTTSTFVLGGKFSNAQFEETVKDVPGWEQVDFRGFMSRDEVKKAYQEAKAGLVTLRPLVSFQDSLPVKMFEYMAAGIPVIASNFSLWEEIITKDNCGLCVDPLSPKAIAGAINYILEHPEEAKAMGENGKRLVLEKYNWKIEEQKLFDLYAKLLS
ncbi:MAG: glycosyltransferase family 4 protein [Crocinitomicaceae bacterium]